MNGLVADNDYLFPTLELNETNSNSILQKDIGEKVSGNFNYVITEKTEDGIWLSVKDVFIEQDRRIL